MAGFRRGQADLVTQEAREDHREGQRNTENGGPLHGNQEKHGSRKTNEGVLRQVALLNEESQEFSLCQQDGDSDQTEERQRWKVPGENIQERKQHQGGIHAFRVKPQRG